MLLLITMMMMMMVGHVVVGDDDHDHDGGDVFICQSLRKHSIARRYRSTIVVWPQSMVWV